MTALSLEPDHGPLAPVKHLHTHICTHYNCFLMCALINCCSFFGLSTSVSLVITDGTVMKQDWCVCCYTCVISCVVISMACSSSLLSSSVGRFMCLSCRLASSFIFWRIRVISYWICRNKTSLFTLLTLARSLIWAKTTYANVKCLYIGSK